MACQRMLLATLVLLSFAFREFLCMGVHLKVPTAVKTGGNISVSCDYTMGEDETLYTMKYFLGDKEFFRRTPSEDPPTNIFTTLSVATYHLEEDGQSITLEGVNKDCTGVYKCEVSVGSPSFYTMTDTKYVTVTEDPEDIPVITSKNEGYQMGKTVKATCTSRGGFPAANLTWFVNGAQLTHADSSEVKHYIQHGDVDSSVSELTWPVTTQPASGVLHLHCVASQFTLYSATSAELLLNEQMAPSSGISTSFTTGRVGWRNIMSTTLSAVVISLVFSSLHRLG